ncbi:AAA family ATPase [bacterium]|nr:AAA family ATPase [bacterium]MBU1918093.1 AAA family ATPase [bacterium]
MTECGQHIYLVCGSGGVGKTTTSASFGLKQAMAGKKVIVLTIDPARRLATALGLEKLSDTPKKIDISKQYKGPGELYAMMLDTKRTFDRLVDKYASSTEARNRIFHNSIYQHLSKMLAGTQEYMAMERLYEVAKSQEYDVLIVDTPPMQNAIEFLRAPVKMMDMINNSMLHLLLKPTMSLGKSGFRLLERGSEQVLKIFDRITGFAFMQDLSEMLIAFKDLLAGFETRAGEVDDLLKNKTSEFIFVTTTSEHAWDELRKFYNQLKERDYKLGRVIVNRVYDGDVFSPAKLKVLHTKLKKEVGAHTANSLVDNYKKFLPLIKEDRKQIKSFEELVSKDKVTTIPLFYGDVCDVKGLYKMSCAL